MLDEELEAFFLEEAVQVVKLDPSILNAMKGGGVILGDFGGLVTFTCLQVLHGCVATLFNLYLISAAKVA